MSSVAKLTDEHIVSLREYEQRSATAPSELVRGKIVTMNPPYPYHGYVCANALGILRQFVRQGDLGYVLGNDSGVITERDPDTLRGADVAFYSYARVPKGHLARRGYLDVAPELIIEVRSSAEPWSEVLTKVSEYLRAGVTVVCVLDLDPMTATIFHSDRTSQTLDSQGILSFPQVLPGFSVQVSKFYE